MVRHAFEILTEGKIKTRLICFSDDMDGLRKVPDNVPNKDMLAAYLDKPLTSVPDPFDNEHASFAAHNNAMLRRFLDQFGSSTSSSRRPRPTRPAPSTRPCSRCSRPTTR